jgi:hypothetical protein
LDTPLVTPRRTIKRCSAFDSDPFSGNVALTEDRP